MAQMDFPKMEEEVLQEWKQKDVFAKSLKARRKAKRFVFYEGPPTANAGPGLHHVLARVFKDIVCRYKTMQGFLVERKGGWDTHGLPVELQIEKKLGLSSKKDIEKYGIAKFNKACKDSVWEFKKEWEDLTERIGFWLDMRSPYITYETSYIESLWWIIKQFWDKGLLYKDYKVIPFCTRCGTPLSSHELAQGYKTVRDRSVYVKFTLSSDRVPRRMTGQAPTYFLAWTTTPWTLPGNVALAVGADIDYVLVEKNKEKYILAKALAEKVLGEYKQIKTFKGKELVGKKYEPLFRFKKPEKGKKAWEVVPADFVSTQDGTGIVHTAVAYGVDDFALGKKENLTMLHLVNEDGTFVKEAVPFKGIFVKDADPLIIEDLKKRNLLLKEELYEHEYPHCWRCESPLLYYAKETWFVDMQKVKKDLKKNNQQINWTPSHIKNGRMGEWLSEVKDWAFSRERYWGTPLPIWECSKCEHREVVGSLEELRKHTCSTNTYYFLRHGESKKNKLGIISSWPEKKPMPLTVKGIGDIKKVAKALQKENIDLIFASDLLRTRQTAEIVGKEIDVKPVLEKRIRENDMGILNGKHISELGKAWGREGETPTEHYLSRFDDAVPKAETWKAVQKRLWNFVQEMEKKHTGKNILIVSHELPMTLFETMAKGFSRKEIVAFRMAGAIQTGEWRKVSFANLPYNEDMEIDMHRPFIDGVEFACDECKDGQMKRVKEVVDVWFDSGAMPFAQNHYPFNKDLLFPADYIVEGIDQTRGWFYTLLAVSTLLGRGTPYKNVVSLGHILDAKGEKMSKSKGNIVNPWEMIEKYGTDAIRWYFFSVSNPGEPKLFSEKDLQQTVRRFLLPLWNSYVFFDTYAAKQKTVNSKQTSKNILDAWILLRLDSTTEEITKKIDEYDITGAARTLEHFVVEDMSLWYIRRSRSRFQNPSSSKELKQASASLAYVLFQVSVLAAPFIPFLAEHIHKQLQKESVHLEDWPSSAGEPTKGKKKQKLEENMKKVREVVASALAERAKAGIRVRQPLALLTIPVKMQKDLAELVRDEVNVKKVVFGKTLKLDTNITPELRREGQLREILRHIQDMRKKAGYNPKHRIWLRYDGDDAVKEIVKSNRDAIKKTVGVKEILVGDKPKQVFDIEQNFELQGQKLWLGMRKV